MNDENKNGEAASQEEGQALSDKEILERAKRENEKLGDERERGRIQWSNYAAMVAMMFACGAVLLAKIFTGDEIPAEIFCIMFSGLAAQNIAQACVCRKQVRPAFIVCAVFITAVALLYWVFWILGLCGVAI